MTRPAPTAPALVATMLAVTGCSGTRLLISTTNSTTRSVTKSTPRPRPATHRPPARPIATRTFSAAGMAISFSYPADFHIVHLAGSKRLAGNIAQALHAAVGTGVYDLLIVSRFPKRPVAVTTQNIRRLQPQFDDAVSSALGRRVTSVVRTVGGLPALAYPPAPIVGLPVAATSRITDAFVGHDQYELDCQYTANGAARINAACDQMLATLRVSSQPR